MHPGISKSSVRKSVRVATAVTGITACAAAFAPMANAQPTAKAASGSTEKAATYQKVVNYKIDTRPETGLDATVSPCGPYTTHWFHLYRTFYQSSLCVAGPGTTGVGGASANGFCGGNNVGYFSGTTVSGQPRRHITFGRGNSVYWFHAPKWPHSAFNISKVYVKSWSGHDACPQYYG